jgi:hypothetical protein
MAITDEVPFFQVRFPDYQKPQDSDLVKLLEKEAEDTSMPTNEGQRTPASGQMYEDPPGRDGESTNARWGEKPHMEGSRQEPFHNSDGVFQESVDVRRGVLDRIFDHFKPAQTETQSQMSGLLDHASNGDFQTHSALLQSKTKTGSAQPSLADQVRKVFKED